MPQLTFIYHHSNGAEKIMESLTAGFQSIQEVSHYLPILDFNVNFKTDCIIHRGLNDEDDLEYWINYARFRKNMPPVIIYSGVITPQRFLRHIRPFANDFSWSLYAEMYLLTIERQFNIL